MLILHPTLSDSAVISTPSTIAGSMPLSNLQKIQPTDRTRFINLSESIIIRVDMTAIMSLGYLTSWNCIYLLFNNSDLTIPLHGVAPYLEVLAATSTAHLDSSTFTSTDVVSLWPSPDLKPYYPRVHTRYVTPSLVPRSDPCVDLIIHNSLNVDGFFEIGRLYVGLAIDLKTPERYPISIPLPSEPERVVRSEGGQDYPRTTGLDEGLQSYPVIFAGDTRLPHAADRAAKAASDFYSSIARIVRLRGSSRDVLIDFDPMDSSWAMEKIIYGRLVGVGQPQLIAPSVYQVVVNVKGMR